MSYQAGFEANRSVLATEGGETASMAYTTYIAGILMTPLSIFAVVIPRGGTSEVDEGIWQVDCIIIKLFSVDILVRVRHLCGR